MASAQEKKKARTEKPPTAKAGSSKAAVSRETASRESSSSGGAFVSKRQSSDKAEQRMRQNEPLDYAIRLEIVLLVIFAVCVFLFLCNLGFGGIVGDHVSRVLFGVFGLSAYVVPVLIFLGVAFKVSNRGNVLAARKLVAIILLFLLVGMIFELFSGGWSETSVYRIGDIYQRCSNGKSGGGILSGTLTYLGCHFLSTVGTVLLILVLGIISFVILTEKSFVSGVKNGSQKVYEKTREDVSIRRERVQQKREEQRRLREEWEEQQRLLEEEKENTKILRMDKKAYGVLLDTKLTPPEELNRPVLQLEEEDTDPVGDDMHEIIFEDGEAVCLQEAVLVPRHENDDGETASAERYPIEEHPIEEDSMEEHSTEMHPMEIHITSVFDDEPEFTGLPEEQKNVSVVSAERGFDYSEFDDNEFVHREYYGMQPQKEPLEEAVRENGRESDGSAYRYREEQSRMYEDAFAKNSRSGQRWEAPWAEEAIPAVRKDTAGTETKRRDRVVIDDAMIRETKKSDIQKEIDRRNRERPAEYQFPPLELLNKAPDVKSGESSQQLEETALRLQKTLATFGVKVTITKISQGPTVTRYELQPDQGVKVSKIVSLTDDIKLNLAATDIRIEAPIPGKPAIGIEVPNKETSTVALRELLESQEFRQFPSTLAFAVGMDIGGKIVTTDIGKMPHLLVAGSTGSGKSVCINTLIMSILYKAKPTEVKLIMIDPKIVELSVYNGIPHLLIPVVTDPKKASAALRWAVTEMDDRYNRFAEMGVRDLNSYNSEVEAMKKSGEEDAPDPMPKIVIIVDELADLMMVASNEVEDSICRLAQKARAAGIHLIIATQRPSVDVITGLIKANVPSRIAFFVSSGVDSRTILDMNGAEKLLGKGDMLFAPQGYPKPVRVQGALVTDPEVANVVDFLKNQSIGNIYNRSVEEKIQNMDPGSGLSGDAEGMSLDAYFAEAGKLIIEKDKASIGMLQRMFKIGFNRAARIMDQLCDAGVVGEEEGTKPRKVLMSMEEFEQLMEEIA